MTHKKKKKIHFIQYTIYTTSQGEQNYISYYSGHFILFKNSSIDNFDVNFILFIWVLLDKQFTQWKFNSNLM